MDGLLLQGIFKHSSLWTNTFYKRKELISNEIVLNKLHKTVDYITHAYLSKKSPHLDYEFRSTHIFGKPNQITLLYMTGKSDDLFVLSFVNYIKYLTNPTVEVKIRILLLNKCQYTCYISGNYCADVEMMSMKDMLNEINFDLDREITEYICEINFQTVCLLIHLPNKQFTELITKYSNEIDKISKLIIEYYEWCGCLDQLQNNYLLNKINIICENFPNEKNSLKELSRVLGYLINK